MATLTACFDPEDLSALKKVIGKLNDLHPDSIQILSEKEIPSDMGIIKVDLMLLDPMVLFKAGMFVGLDEVKKIFHPETTQP